MHVAYILQDRPIVKTNVVLVWTARKKNQQTQNCQYLHLGKNHIDLNLFVLKLMKNKMKLLLCFHFTPQTFRPNCSIIDLFGFKIPRMRNENPFSDLVALGPVATRIVTAIPSKRECRKGREGQTKLLYSGISQVDFYRAEKKTRTKLL